MSCKNGKTLIITLAIAAVTASCAATPRTLPFEELDDTGVSFWMISPVTNVATYAFYSDGDELQFARSLEAGLRFGELVVSECLLLGAALEQFQESLLESIEISFGRAPAIAGAEIVMDSPSYRARFVPGKYLDSISLEGWDDREVPWVVSGHDVFSRISACDDSQ